MSQKHLNQKQSSRGSWWLAAIVGLTLLTGLGSSLLAQETKSGEPSAAPVAAEVQVARTAAEHEAMAETYRKKMAECQKEIDLHQAMLANYKKRVPQLPKEPLENAYVKKMRLHCERYIHAAQQLKGEAEKMAEYHRLRAAELKGH